MGIIRLLSDLVASQVAAGEVVERPASVLKELVENSIDAGAKRIEVTFAQGGSKLLRVSDDGCGMDRSDALLSLERHATSKIRTLEDLSVIGTLGFRGEAVPSIASVSRFRLSTHSRSAGGIQGTQITVDGGKIIDVREHAQSYGTEVEVKDLFFNVPARRKFLKSEKTETAHLLEQLQILAVAHPEIAFACLHEGREIFRLGSSDSLAVRLRDLYGARFLESMQEVTHTEMEGISVNGFFARPGEGRSDRSLQFLFINGRMIRSPFLSQALREGCNGILPKGLHPQAVLFFTLDPAKVDCNVHPAKREVRFQEPGKIKAVALHVVEKIMGNYHRIVTPMPLEGIARPYEVIRPAAAQPFLPVIKTAMLEESAIAPLNVSTSTYDQKNHQQPNDLNNPLLPVIPFLQEKRSLYRYVGSVAERYFIMEEGDGFTLVEVRAALERITYERLRHSFLGGMLERQQLLLPEIIEVSPSHYSWIMAHEEFFKKAGLEMDSFGQGIHGRASQSLKIDTIPTLLNTASGSQILYELMGALQMEEGKTKDGLEVVMRMHEEILARSLSRMTAKIQKIVYEEKTAIMLLGDLLKCELPYATPSGRPTMIQFSAVALERKFRC